MLCFMIPTWSPLKWPTVGRWRIWKEMVLGLAVSAHIWDPYLIFNRGWQNISLHRIHCLAYTWIINIVVKNCLFYEIVIRIMDMCHVVRPWGGSVLAFFCLNSFAVLIFVPYKLANAPGRNPPPRWRVQVLDVNRGLPSISSAEYLLVRESMRWI
jgi:hypothetical protein